MIDNSQKIADLKKQIAVLMDEECGYPKSTLGLKLRAARKSASLKQQDLADLIGAKRTTIVNIELGSQGIKISTLVSLCKTLSLSADYLLSLKEDNDPPV